MFEQLLDSVERALIDQRLENESRLDPDYWIVEIEARDGQVELPLAAIDREPREADQLFRF